MRLLHQPKNVGQRVIGYENCTSLMPISITAPCCLVAQRSERWRSVFCSMHSVAMQNQVNILGLAVLVSCCGFLMNAMAYPADVPPNPVQYKRFLRRRADPKNPELEVYEVREVFYYRRTTPRPKVFKQLTDLDMDLHILCDFEPTMPECTKFSTKSSVTLSSSSTSSTTTTSTTEATSTTTIATTNTDLPFLPELSQMDESTPEPEEEDDYEVGGNDDTDNFEKDDDVNNEGDIVDMEAEKEPDADDYLNLGGSIGGNDSTI